MPRLLPHPWTSSLRRRSLYVCVLAGAIAYLPAAPAFAQSEAAETETAPSEASDLRSTAQIRVGDKLQLSFFEHLDFGRSGEDEVAGGVRTFYQRLDLTGEYVVDVDGSIIIPLVGRFVLAELSPQEAQARIKENYERVMDRGGDVHVSIAERQPVYVTGIVRAPGAFRYEPGMIAVQAITLAGGYDRNMQASARMLEALREDERLERASAELDRLIAKRERLLRLKAELPEDHAERTDDPATTAGIDRVDLSAPDAHLVETETAVHAAAAELDDVLVASAVREVEALGQRQELVERQLDISSERLHVIQQMQGRGLATLELMWNAQKEVSNFEMRREELAADKRAAERQVGQREAERVTRRLTEAAEIERELILAEESIERMTNEMEAARGLYEALRTDASADGLGPDERLAVHVVRRSASGVETVAADETTALLPGDVVKVERAPAAMAEAALP